jgi:hypothetical protein
LPEKKSKNGICEEMICALCLQEFIIPHGLWNNKDLCGALVKNTLNIHYTRRRAGRLQGQHHGGNRPRLARRLGHHEHTDVKENEWYYDAVKFISQNSLMSGTSTTAFEPDADMTRAMLVTVLYRLEGKPTVTGPNSFTDVERGRWYTDAVIWESTNIIVSGYGGGLFGISDSVTREQLAVILYNYAKYKGYDVTKAISDLSLFTDASDISSWAQAAISWANAEGHITGTTMTTLAPTGTATRAQVATILMRFLKYVAK